MPHALITGCGGHGLGSALAGALAHRGWSVTATCRTEAQAAALLADTHGTKITALPLDVRDDAALAALPSQLGVRALDLVMSNAAFARREGRIADVERESFLRAIEVNAFGLLALARACAPLLVRAERPRLVALGSTQGSLAAGGAGAGYGYAMSKAALNMGVAKLACDPAMAGILIASVHPGWVRTKLGGDNAPLSPAAAAVRLADFAERIEQRHHGGFFDSAGNRLPW